MIPVTVIHVGALTTISFLLAMAWTPVLSHYLYQWRCWKKKARIDLKNVGGAIEDALWKRDRRVLEEHWIAEEHTGRENISVQVEIR